ESNLDRKGGARQLRVLFAASDRLSGVPGSARRFVGRQPGRRNGGDDCGSSAVAMDASAHRKLDGTPLAIGLEAIGADDGVIQEKETAAAGRRDGRNWVPG